ncbi:MAG: 50S ribosomal protein L13 [Chloroflexi bacterium]|nr:50S ribosomal protein L13 [Chloroflexota bacterium]|tara:strand:+ start:144 stop:788 length:645 start_codon:yes stop_codon:yes gene_type:complete
MSNKIEQYNPSAKEIVNDWKVVDANGQTLGILASNIATMLMGKHKPNYVPHMLTGDYVVVINASGIKVTGMKSEQKLYTRHSQYPGNIKKIPYNRMPSSKVIQLAVKGMLPKNKLSSKMLKRLKIYDDSNHPHSAQLLGTENRLNSKKESLSSGLKSNKSSKKKNDIPSSATSEENKVSAKATTTKAKTTKPKATTAKAKTTKPKATTTKVKED